jgi:predicted patatin/cPLA2 family phospholipase
MSVIDYALFWSTYLSDLKTKEEYYQYIEKHYSQTPGYSLRVMNLEKEYFEKLKNIKAKNSYDIFDTDTLNTSNVKKRAKKIDNHYATNDSINIFQKNDSTKTQ